MTASQALTPTHERLLTLAGAPEDPGFFDGLDVSLEDLAETATVWSAACLDRAKLYVAASLVLGRWDSGPEAALSRARTAAWRARHHAAYTRVPGDNPPLHRAALADAHDWQLEQLREILGA